MQPAQKISQAKEAIQQMDFAHARALLTDLLASDAQNIEAWVLLARVSLERQEAIHCLEKVLSLEPSHYEAHEMLHQFRYDSKTKRTPQWLKDSSKLSNRRTTSTSSPGPSANSPRLVLGPVIGAFASSSVKLWGRASGPATLHAWISKKRPFQPYLAGKFELFLDTGYSGAIEITSLEAQTEYSYALKLSATPPPASDFNTFKTAPPQGQNSSFQFAFGSCFRPTSRVGSGRIFKQILDSHPDLSFMIMLGDQIYADEWGTNGLDRGAVNVEDYREVYRHSWTNQYIKELFCRIPVFMTLDDHEVDNDWHWCDTNKTLAKIPFYTKIFRWLKRRPIVERELSSHRVQAALQAYWDHQGIHAPTFLGNNQSPDNSSQIADTTTGPFAYKFDFGTATFYVMDTRTQRVCSKGYNAVLGEDQWTDLEQWLLESNEKNPVKFIVTSSSFLTMMLGDFSKDRWSAFPVERDRLLKFISKHGINGVHFLTGDLHSGHAVSTNLRQESGHGIQIWEYCSSPFEQDPNFLARLISLRNPSNKLWEDYRVHFIVDKCNYGVVTVFLNDPNHPSVHFDLHYQSGEGAWNTKSVSDIQ